MGFKTFIPKADKVRKLVLFRWYSGVRGSNGFCYKIVKITNKGQVDKRFAPLFAYGTDDYDEVGEFRSSATGLPARVYKTAFRSVYGVGHKSNPISIWNKANLK